MKRIYHGIELPEQDNLKVALRLAREKLARVDPRDAADRLGCKLTKTGDKAALSFEFMGDPISVVIPDGVAHYEDGRPLPDFFLGLVLHYLISPGRDLENELITYVQVPSGLFYEEPFNKHTKYRLLETFGEDIGLFRQVAERLGWQPVDSGDVGAIALPFPKVPIHFILYGRDNEFAPDASILFDKTIPKFLPLEDIKLVTGLLIGSARKTAASIKGEKQ